MNKSYSKWLKIESHQVQEELKQMKPEQIESAFSGTLSFGTAGLRGIMGLGTNRINDINICKLANAVLEYFKQKKYKSIVIGYDTRHNSRNYSKIFANVLAGGGIKVNMFKSYVPTPLLIYSIGATFSDMGIMITASHNNKIYNGVKISGSDGIQISGEAEKKIGKLYSKLDEVELYNNYLLAKFTNKFNFLGKAIKDGYLGNFYKNKINGLLNIIYTPLNGTAYDYVMTALKGTGFKRIVTPRNQKGASGDFKSCPYPNPEFIEAYNECLKCTDLFDADIIVATDPDGDRLGAMIKSTKGYKLLSGNEIGFLLLGYMHENKAILSNEYAVSTVVSSPMFFNMCDEYKIKYEKTLTGFKNIGRAKLNLEQKYGRDGFILAYEESCGYIAKDNFYDKDGTFALLKLCELASYLKNSGSSVEEYLNSIYTKFGNIYSLNSSVKFDGENALDKMNSLVNSIREKGVKSLLKNKILKQVDYLNDNTGLDKSNFIEYKAKNFSFIIRPSGTEPKLKIYIHASGKNLESSKKYAQEILEAIKSEILGIKEESK